mmetsp:Transcript_6368/g.15499  ORF Transcript_6368/g.15499 Transcript_6368/m.15499 type:complete len:243 (-) Transcript_6368:574-1302(-)
MYFAWLLGEKVIVLSVTAAAVGQVNAGLSITIYTIRLGLLLWMRPFNDHKINATEILAAFTTLGAVVLASMPAFAGNINYVPEWARGSILIWLSTSGTAIAAFSSILSPILDMAGTVAKWIKWLFVKIKEKLGFSVPIPKGMAGDMASQAAAEGATTSVAMAAAIGTQIAEQKALERAAGPHLTREGSQRFMMDKKKRDTRKLDQHRRSRWNHLVALSGPLRLLASPLNASKARSSRSRLRK